MPKLSLKESNEAKLFRGLVARLKNDPDLKRVVKRWCVFDGSQNELREPTDSDYPFVMISPSGERGETVTQNSTLTTMKIEISLFTAGTNVDDPMNLWSALRSAIWAGDNTLQALQNECLCEKLSLDQPVYQARALDSGSNVLVATGSISANLRTKTRN